MATQAKLQVIDADAHVIGTGYGHTDPSSDLEAILVPLGQEGISRDTKDRIIHHNPKTLYNL